MHDVGKIAIPDNILLKPGRLTPDQQAVIETHAETGYRMLTGSNIALLEQGAEIALSHHESFDGHGDPRGLAGEAIPLDGRIAAVADVFDALRAADGHEAAAIAHQALSTGVPIRAVYDHVATPAMHRIGAPATPPPRATAQRSFSPRPKVSITNWVSRWLLTSCSTPGTRRSTWAPTYQSRPWLPRS
jgi:hypothetical protein